MTVTEYLRRLQKNIPFFTQQKCLQAIYRDHYDTLDNYSTIRGK